MVRSRLLSLLLLSFLAAAFPGCSAVGRTVTAAQQAAKLAATRAQEVSLDDLEADVRKPAGAAEVLVAHFVLKDPKDKELALFNAAFCQDLGLRITRLPEVRGQVPGRVVDAVMKQYGIAGVNLSPENGVKVARLAGRGHVSTGTIERDGDRLRARVEVFDAKSGKKLGEAIELAGTQQEFLDREGRVAGQIAQRIGVKLTASDRAWLNHKEFADLADFMSIARLTTHEAPDHTAKLAARREQKPKSLLVEMTWFECRDFKDDAAYLAALEPAHKRFPEEPTFLGWLIEEHMRRADKAAAKAALAEYERLHPGSWEGLNLRARYADMLEHDYAANLRATESMAALYPDCWMSWLRLSYAAAALAYDARAGYYFSEMNPTQQAAFRRGMSESLAAAERSRELNNRDADVLVKLIHLYRENGRPKQAEEAFRQAIAVDPGRVDAYDALAVMYNPGYQNDEKRMMAITRQSLDAPARTWPALQAQAENAFILKEKERGLKLYQKAFEAAGDARCADLHLSYADTIAKEYGRWDEAEKHARIAVNQEPSVASYLTLVRSLTKLKRFDEALKVVDQAKGLDPEDPDVVATLAAVQNEMGDTAAGLKTMSRAYAREPRGVEYLGAMLDGYLTQGEYDKAWEVMQEIKQHPGWEESQIELLDVGDIHALKGQYRDAITYYDLNLKDKPGHVKSLTRGALCYMIMGDFKGAAARWQKVLAKEPRHAESHMGLAVCLQNLGQQDKALTEAHKAVSLDPKSADPAWLKTNCYWPDEGGQAAAQLAAAARKR
jgi:pentatricopeptide repeat protein